MAVLVDIQVLDRAKLRQLNLTDLAHRLSRTEEDELFKAFVLHLYQELVFKHLNLVESVLLSGQNLLPVLFLWLIDVYLDDSTTTSLVIRLKPELGASIE